MKHGNRRLALRRWVPVWAAVSVFCTCAPALSQLAVQPNPPAGPFGPANFNQQTDSMGFRWDVNQYGMINDGSNDAFDGGLSLRIGNTQFQSTQRLMAAANNEFVLNGRLGTFQVTRRVKIDRQRSFARYIESFTNPGSTTQTINFKIYTDLGTTPQSWATNTGRLPAGVLTKKENSIACYQQPNSSRPSVVMYFGNARSKVKPTVSKSGDDVSVNVSLQVGPGKTVSYLHAVAQRRLAGPLSTKQMDALIKPLEKRDFLKDVPTGLRRTIVNYGTVLFGGALGEAGLLKLNIASALQVQPGSNDILAIGENSRLQGSASCDGLKINTKFGVHEIAFDDVAALAGKQWTGDKDQVFLRDGQVLTGDLAATGLKFSTVVGSSTDLSIDSLDRLVMRRTREPIEPVGDLYVVTFDGDRVAVSYPQETRVPLLTMWGVLKVRLDEIAWVVPSDADVPGFQVRLKNGSRFFAYVKDTVLPLDSPVTGKLDISSSELRGFVASEFADGREDDESLHARPRVVLRGGQVLVGRFAEDAVDVQTEGQALLIPRDEIRTLQRREPENDLLPNPEPLFVAFLWSGDVIAGNLRERMFAVQVDDQICTVPLRDLVEMHIPVPKLTVDGRTKILDLIDKLGEEDWRMRNAATRQLAEAGYLAVPLLRDASKTSPDPEVRRRSRLLVEQLDVPAADEPR